MTLPIDEAGPDPRLLDLLVCPLTKGPCAMTASATSWSASRRASPIRSATASRSCWSRRRGRWTTASACPRRSARMTGSGAGPWPLEIRVKRAEQALEVDFDDGATFRYPAELLRVESPSAEVQGHSPSQKVTLAGKRERRHHRARAGRQLRGQGDLRRRPQHRHLLLALSLPSGREQARSGRPISTALAAQGLTALSASARAA